MMKDFTKYSSIEFAENPSFIKWVLESDPEASEFWENWIAENTASHSKIDKAKRILGAVNFVEEEPDSAVVNQLWDSIDQKISENLEHPVYINLYFW